MNNEEIEQIIREYITKIPHMSLAASSNNRPWVCEVHFAYDVDLNLYFVSKEATRHCQEIAENPYVAGNIVKQHSLSESPNGIYFEGVAEAIEATKLDVERYCTALNRETAELASRLQKPEGYRMYKIRVNKWAVFGNFDSKGNAKYELEWGRM
jgi:uncharacterized protein YhbP (UPF0306 family)